MKLDTSELSKNVKKYISLYKKSEQILDEQEQENILEKMEELYFELDDEEQSFLEFLGIC